MRKKTTIIRKKLDKSGFLEASFVCKTDGKLKVQQFESVDNPEPNSL